ncbi:MAG TPA: glucans biosynthesis glucosyltransferase MdoH, partial [Variovorax sp.]|nr:glucans biosynthesis glucosyltransferase MdoH [Variovorax sp.]
MKPTDFSQMRVLTEDDFSRRVLPREERHPNSVTAPPVHRGSMAPRPWRGFWNSIGTAMLVRLGAGGAEARETFPELSDVEQPWQRAARQRRLAFMLLAIVSTAIASSLFASVQPDYNNVWLEYGQIGLYGLLSGWVVTGFVTALMGFYVSVRGDKHALSVKQIAGHPMNPEARTAIIMPICNEDVATVFAGLRATCESVASTGHAKHFDVFVLSDSYNPETAAAERAAWEDLRAALATSPNQPQVEVYYRLRKRRTHRKAGNVADFCRRWGKDYRYMVVLDADS